MKSAWRKRSLLWLSGARSVGKTTLARMLDNTVYMNFDLPAVNRKLEDPESFYESLDPVNILIFDEVDRLEDPCRVIKIGTDEFPEIKILATGSSTLEATRKFKDSLTGRKISIYLPPVIWDECKKVFGIKDLEKRILQGGLPEPLLLGSKDPSFFSEWFDSFYARDIQEIFYIRNRTGYLKLMRLLYRSSGNLVEYTQLSRDSGLSRPTVMAYIESLRISQNIYLPASFHGRGKREITAKLKIYAFNTGFVTYINDWNEVREPYRIRKNDLKIHFTGTLHTPN